MKRNNGEFVNQVADQVTEGWDADFQWHKNQYRCDGCPQYQPLPPVLHKAIGDQYNYLVVLKDGQRFTFNQITDCGDGWIHLDGESSGPPYETFHGARQTWRNVRVVAGRGIDLRLDTIAFAIDADS